MDGRARSTFLRNRIGFCVLHPPDPLHRSAVRRRDRRRGDDRGHFPRQIAPEQPFREMRAIGHEVAPGVRAECASRVTSRDGGSANRTDDSYKTYCTPLRLPFPGRGLAGRGSSRRSR
jgi:hypothetical protein